MGQTRSDLSHSAATPGLATWKPSSARHRLSISRLRSKRKPRSEQLSRSPMSNNVLSCLGGRKRHCSHTEEGSGDAGADAGDPAARCGHRAVKLPKDEAASAAGCFETSPDLGGGAAVVQLEAAETRSGEVSSEEPRAGEREDDASEPPARAMEDQPGGRQYQADLHVNPHLLYTSDPEAKQTSPPDQDLGRGLKIRDDRMKRAMTKTEPAAESQNNGFPGGGESVKPSDPADQSRRRHRFHGPIPKLIITTANGFENNEEEEDDEDECSPEPHGDDESPCSDSGCGGSPTMIRVCRKLSSSSSIGLSSASSFEESEDDFTGSDVESSLSPTRSLFSAAEATRNKSWTKLKSMVHWTPLAFTIKSRHSWVQLAGHAGNFQARDGGRLMKRYCQCEEHCLKKLTLDSLCHYVPSYYGVVQKDGETYNLMQDLLVDFVSPSIMDCKMGSRTYLEEELMKARESPRLRKDMYEKMISVDPGAPTVEERAQQGILKTRYMQWRETLSSTATLGFRIEGIKKSDGTCNTSFKKTKHREQVMKALEDFVDGNVQILKVYLQRLEELRSVLEESEFFKTHEVVGSSLLFVHDTSGKASVWMIDFGKTVPLPHHRTLDHRTPWVEGNREDGYLWGMDNLIDILSSMLPRTPCDGDETSEDA